MKRSRTNRILELSAILALAVAVPGLGACAGTSAPMTGPADAGDVAEVQAPSTEVAYDDPSAAQTDEQISAALSARLDRDPDPDLHAIGVNTAEGVVTLTGNVSSPGARNVALSIAGDIAGVMSVNDDLVVGDDVVGDDEAGSK